ncbi:GAF and ANTAR domain-containing protein [Streptomyces sp. NBC_00237]|uniref:GAF and ANTAR domain-containing protein n=1 Tax=Streptomyces sp. NBC_00237 TaxID=2975687 RepID=UPI002256172D|nr:GAF and ANTAR domain-containing protein [Streptomyces sp. NBC_00237]MCX5205756.1 GAF and ANTAR domain-containing protein [Streptomyces sp. NBC_00237]
MISDPMAALLRRLNTADPTVADDCARVLGADGLAVSALLEGGAREVIWATPGLGTRFEELQFTLGEGPGPDAARTGTVSLTGDLRAMPVQRWPALLPALSDDPVGSVFCFPLNLGAITVGVLTLTQETPGVLDAQQWDDATVLAAALTSLLLDGDRHRLESLTTASTQAVLRQAAVHQATGMMSVQLGVPLSEALLHLRAHAYRHNAPLGDIASDVVARRLRFPQPTPTHGPTVPEDPKDDV